MLYGTVCFHKNPFLSTTTAPSGVTSILMVKLRNATRNCDSQQYTTHRKNTKCEPKRKQRVCLSISRLTFWRICNSPSFASHTSQVVVRESIEIWTSPLLLRSHGKAKWSSSCEDSEHKVAVIFAGGGPKILFEKVSNERSQKNGKPARREKSSRCLK